MCNISILQCYVILIGNFFIGISEVCEECMMNVYFIDCT